MTHWVSYWNTRLLWPHDKQDELHHRLLRCGIRAQGPLDAIMINEIECDISMPSGEHWVGRNVHKLFPVNEEVDIKTTCSFRNAHSGVIDVCQIQSPHRCVWLFSVGWYSVDPRYHDSRGHPVAMALNVPCLAFGTFRATTFTDYFFAASLALRPCTLCLRPYSRVMCATIFIRQFMVIPPSMALSWSDLPRFSGSQKNMVYSTFSKILPFSWLSVDFGTRASNRALSMSSNFSCKIRLIFAIFINVGGVSNTAMSYSRVKGVVCRAFTIAFQYRGPILGT